MPQPQKKQPAKKTTRKPRVRKPRVKKPTQPDIPIHFICGLRSGNTLLANFMGQNPALHVTGTSGLPGQILAKRDNWWRNDAWRAQGLAKIKPRILAGVRGDIKGFYKDKFDAGKIVLDKSRGWLPLIGQMEEVLGRRVNVIVTIRDPRAVIASLEKLYRASPWTVRDIGPSNPAAATLVDRVKLWLSPQGLAGSHFNHIRNAVTVYDESTLRVPYVMLTRDPMSVVKALAERLGLPAFDGYDPDNVEQITQEDDSVHGMSLHTIRPKIESAGEIPWAGVLPDELANEIAKLNPDIVQWAQS